MRFKIIFIIGLLVLGLSCKKDEPIQTVSIDGKYKGTFERSGTITKVELNLTEGKFSGSTELSKFPAICHGEFSITNNTIKFKDLCFWTADFDWSLILNETWNFNFEDDVLILTNSLGDKYVLSRM